MVFFYTSQLLAIAFALATLVAGAPVENTTDTGIVRACSCSRGFINVPVDTQVAADPVANNFLNATALRPLKATWPIFAELCQPVGGVEIPGVQLMLHGQTYTAQYWNPLFSGFENYSYVEYSCSRGLSSLAYDNVGAGLSFRPVNASDVQMPSAIQVLANLGKMLKSGAVSTQLTGVSKAFSKVVALGHSVGSSVLNYELIIDGDQSPFTGAIHTGSVHDKAFITTPFPINLTVPANQVEAQWADLDPGYVVTPSIAARLFFYSPNPDDFSNELFDIDEATKSPGPGFVSKQIKNIYQPSNYSGNVAVVVGALDRTHCLNNNNQPCTVQSLQQSEPQFFPRAKSLSLHTIENSGHDINYHFAAAQAFPLIFSLAQSFLSAH